MLHIFQMCIESSSNPKYWRVGVSTQLFKQVWFRLLNDEPTESIQISQQFSFRLNPINGGGIQSNSKHIHEKDKFYAQFIIIHKD